MASLGIHGYDGPAVLQNGLNLRAFRTDSEPRRRDGHNEELEGMLDVILPEADDTLVFLGDLVDQGPETRGGVSGAIKLKSLCRVVLIEGNHEEMMFACAVE